MIFLYFIIEILHIVPLSVCLVLSSDLFIYFISFQQLMLNQELFLLYIIVE